MSKIRHSLSARSWRIALLRAFALLGLVAGGSASAVAATQPPPGAEAITIEMQPIPLDPRQGQSSVGELDYLAGYELSSTDGGWGGFSGLAVSRDGTRLIAISDVGLWLDAHLVNSGDRLTGIDKATLAPMLDANGARLLGKSMSDAEGLSYDIDGSLLVSFERTGRLWRYGVETDMEAAVAEPEPSPLDNAPLPDNGGAEAVVALADGTILILTEGAPRGASDATGWIGRQGKWSTLRWARTGLFRVTDAALLPNGDLLVLERRYTQIGGPAARLSVVRRAAIEPNARLSGREIALIKLPMNVDNFEGLAVRAGSSGTLIYLISDDNRSPVQRTLLMEFRWLAH
jgi:hypothetical protein